MTLNRICLVSSGHLASNPRLVKEADALQEAGFAVVVVAGNVSPGVRRLDATILARVSWPVVMVGLDPRRVYLARRLRQELASRAYPIGGIRTAQWALSPITESLASAAAAQPADLYIAHNLAALPAAAFAARLHRAKLGFDAEDDHVGELEDTPDNRAKIEIRRQIEGHYLPLCHHLTAASPGIAKAYRERYRVNLRPVLNVFPLSQAPAASTATRRRTTNQMLSVYWFSQTIGPDRGLEPFIKAMEKLRGMIALSIRGSDFLGYSTHLKAVAADVGVADAIHFLPSAPPDEMARLAAQHDVGLASELTTPPHHAISLSNKIFTYLLAGIPVIMSDTPAQRELAPELGEAARVVDLTNPDSITAALGCWALDAEALGAAKRAAWLLGQARFNWDVEKEQLLHAVRVALELTEPTSESGQSIFPTQCNKDHTTYRQAPDVLET